MAGTDYIPDKDADFRAYAVNFSTRITLNPSLYMLTAGQAASIQNVTDNFLEALDVATAPATRTAGTVAAKDDARSICEGMIRQYAIDVKNNEGITDEDKIDLGVRPINPNREEIECPQTSPLMNIIAATPGSHTLRYADTNTPDSAARPFGASELQLFCGVTADEPATLAQSQFYGKVTRNPVNVEFSEADDGKMATYYARWCSVRGEVGPWSLPVSMRVAA